MTTTTRQAIRLFAGESATYRITALAVSDDAPISLQGSALEFEVKRSPGEPDPPVIAKTIGAGITVLDQIAAPGQFDVDIDAADTAGLVGLYYFDVFIISAGRRYVVVPPSAFIVSPTVNS